MQQHERLQVPELGKITIKGVLLQGLHWGTEQSSEAALSPWPVYQVVIHLKII